MAQISGTEIQCINVLMLQPDAFYEHTMQENTTAAAVLPRTVPDLVRGACSAHLDPRADFQRPNGGEEGIEITDKARGRGGE